MRKLMTKKFKKIICLVLVFTFLISMILQTSQVEVKAATTTTWLPITCYTNTTSNVNTYTSEKLTKNTGYICSGDLCTITKIYSNGAVQVTYPVAGGKNKTAYASSKDFFYDINFSTATISFGKKLTVYRKSSGSSTIGTVYASDKVMVCGVANGRTQIIYPAGSSWKLGWVSGTYPVNSDYYMIVTALKDSMVLDVDGNSTKNGANVQIYKKSDNNAAQIYYVESINNGYYKILNSSSGKALDVTGGVKKSGVNVQMYEYNGTDSQIWKFIDAGNGYFYIQNKLGYMLDVSGGRTANKTNVQVYEKNNTNSQKWKLVKVNMGNQWDSLVGTTVADVNSKYYTAENISYLGGYKGQCTWYAYGRFFEVTGVKLSTARNANLWLSDNVSNSKVLVTYGGSNIKAKSIAVRTSGKYGHVIFIEEVTYKNGTPEYVYFTECNSDGNGKYDKGKDCIVQKMSYSKFIQDKNIAGYISAK